jgi:hypothetical protein
MSLVTSNITKVITNITNVLKPKFTVTISSLCLSTLQENFKHFRTILGWRINYSHTSLFERLDFVLGHTLPLTQLLQHNKRKTLD